MEKDNNSSYSIYNEKAKQLKKINPLEDLYPQLPPKKYSVIYADPPWNYGGKMQYDNSGLMSQNEGYKKDIFISAAEFKYPTLKLNELKQLDINSIAEDDCLLFLWTTGPQLENSISLGTSWGFEYKTIAFVWDKMMHNPGHYTVSETEMVLVFKKGRIPRPRGARNMRQLLSHPRGAHSEKPIEIINRITKMFPTQEKIELFARNNYNGWDNWGLEIPESKLEILNLLEIQESKNK